MARKVVVLGCGRLGAMVTQSLLEQGDSVVVLDHVTENFRRLRSHQNLQMLVLDGASADGLRRAGIEDADVFVALAAQDTTNALAAQIAQITFNVPNVVCRLNDPVRRDMYRGLGLKPVSPTQIAADMVLEAGR